MTSTPVSLRDKSLDGSWIEINSASQIPSPMGFEDGKLDLRQPQSSTTAGPAQNLGLISFQVERFLQEAQRNTRTSKSNDSKRAIHNTHQPPNLDDVDLSYSDSELSIDDMIMMNALRDNQANERNNNEAFAVLSSSQPNLNPRKFGDCLDQLSDSLSLLSRCSAFNGVENAGGATLPRANSARDLHDFDWLWDWTAQPEYFSGQEWKVYAPKQDHLMRQRQMYYNERANSISTNSDIVSLLFVTNMLSIIIGAGLTYSILMRRSTP